MRLPSVRWIQDGGAVSVPNRVREWLGVKEGDGVTIRGQRGTVVVTKISPGRNRG